jgi:hypothetical protein
LDLLKSRSFTIVRIILGIKIVKSSKTSNNIIQNLLLVFHNSCNKTHSQDHNATQHVWSQSILNKIVTKHCSFKQISHIIKFNVKNLQIIILYDIYP